VNGRNALDLDFPIAVEDALQPRGQLSKFHVGRL